MIASVEIAATRHFEACPRAVDSPEQPAPLNRLREARIAEGVSRRSMAQRLNISLKELAAQEDENADLPLSVLYQWEAALDVPLAELVAEPRTSLSQPILQRARMVRLMRTVVTLCRRARAKGVRCLSQRLFDQLVEIMPELQGVQEWPSIGQRRRRNELGVAFDRGQRHTWGL